MYYKSYFFAILSMGLLLTACAQEIPNRDAQIAMAVKAAPEELRAEATVYGYDADGKLLTIREGKNELICLADDPNKAGFDVACYHKDLETFMARGRELKAQGKNAGEIFDMREAEAKAGTLILPDQPTTLHILFGKEASYDAAQDTVLGAEYRYVVYIPWATAESTGLPAKPVVPGGPWIMNPGTHRAHIMISTPPRN